jgi:hypothetical protein
LQVSKSSAKARDTARKTARKSQKTAQCFRIGIMSIVFRRKGTKNGMKNGTLLQISHSLLQSLNLGSVSVFF